MADRPGDEFHLVFNPTVHPKNRNIGFSVIAAVLAIGAQLLLAELVIASIPDQPIVVRKIPQEVQIAFISQDLAKINVNSSLPQVEEVEGTTERLGELEAPTTTLPRMQPSTQEPTREARSPTSIKKPEKADSEPPRPAIATRPAKIEPKPVAVAVKIPEVKEAKKTTEISPASAPAAEPKVEKEASPSEIPDTAPAVIASPPPVKLATPVPEPVGETRQPREIRGAVPVYPSIARSQRISGTVIVEITVGVDGSVEEAKVVKTPSPLLNKAAVVAAKKIKYEPALANGVPIRANVLKGFKFSLNR